MQLTNLDFLFWAIGLFGHVALLCVVWIRRRAMQFPIFTAFIAANVVRTLVLYITLHHGSRQAYFSTYWTLAIADLALQLLVVYEMASNVFRPLGKWAQDVRRGSLWLLSGSVAIASGLTWLADPATRTWKQNVVIRGNFFSSALMSELFVGMIALSITAGLQWKTHIAKIAQGLGAYSIVCVLIEFEHSYYGVAHETQTYVRLSHIRIATYLVCVGYWIVMLWRNAPSARELPDKMRRQLSTLHTLVTDDLYKIRSWRR